MYGPAIAKEFTKIKGVHCAKEDIYVFAVFHGSFVKMVGAKLAQLEASGQPSVVGKYFQPSKESDVDLTNQDQLCKIWAGDGYSTKSVGSTNYLLKDVVVDKKHCAGTGT